MKLIYMECTLAIMETDGVNMNEFIKQGQLKMADKLRYLLIK